MAVALLLVPAGALATDMSLVTGEMLSNSDPFSLAPASDSSDANFTLDATVAPSYDLAASTDVFPSLEDDGVAYALTGANCNGQTAAYTLSVNLDSTLGQPGTDATADGASASASITVSPTSSEILGTPAAVTLDSAPISVENDAELPPVMWVPLSPMRPETPEPAAVFLLGGGLVALGWLGRRKKPR
jgi:hypothetical protein